MLETWLTVAYETHFIGQIKKIIEKPEVGRPMRFSRRDTREVYIPPFRLSYIYIKKEDKVILLNLHHKNEQ